MADKQRALIRKALQEGRARSTKQSVPLFDKALAALEREDKQNFEQGFACACATMLEMHKEDTQVMDTLRTCFPTLESLRASKADPHDLKPLVALWKREVHGGRMPKTWKDVSKRVPPVRPR